jgi:nucleoid-associated protein YgaU
MGLFDFVKDAGEKIAEDSREKYLQDQVAKLGLNVRNLSVTSQGDVVTVSGNAATLADREKAVLAIGNLQGVARVDDRIEVDAPPPPAVMLEIPPPAEQPSTFYTVKAGDTLSKIAKHHYGDGNKYNVIFEANRPLLKDPNKIYPGQVLRIPPLS